MKRLSVLLAALTLVSCGNARIPTEVHDKRLPGTDEPPVRSESIEPIDESVLPPIEIARVSFVAAGDNVIHKGIMNDAKRRADGDREYDFRPMYADVGQFIADFDLAFINQETLMAGEEYGYSAYPLFNSPRQLAYDLIDVGFDVVNIANNHMCDKGVKGLAATVEFWKTLDATMIGGYLAAEDYESPRIVEVEGIKLAFLGYTEETNQIRLRADEPIVPYTVDETLKQQIKAAEKIADFVIVSVHWGNENTTTPTSEQKRLAKLMSEAGADLIIGHHPHVLQPIDWIESDGNRTLCVYSLGNLLSMMEKWQNMIGGLLTLDFVKMSSGEVYIDSPRMIPTVFWFSSGFYQTELFFLDDYTEAKASTHGTIKNYGSKATLEELNAFADRVLGEFRANVADIDKK